MNEELHLFLALNGSVSVERNVQCVAYAGCLYYGKRRCQFGQLTMDVFYHFLVVVFYLLMCDDKIT